MDGREYRYDGQDVIVSISDITIVARPRAVGPVLPVIPMSDRSFEDDDLKLTATILGSPSAPDKPPAAISISAFVAGVPVPVRGSHAARSPGSMHEGKLVAQYNVTRTFGIRLGAVRDATFTFDLPMFAAHVPDLQLVRQDISDNWVVLTPGP